MEFVKIDVSIPEKVKEFYQMIFDIEPNCCIAGGFLFDLYTGHSYRDVDLFIHPSCRQDILRLLLKKNISIQHRGDSYSFFSMDVYNLVYHGYAIQLIFKKTGADSARQFDIRMRELYYHDQQTYISKEALRDIQEKKIVIGVVQQKVLESIRRVFIFQQRYGYAIDRPSFYKLLDGCEVFGQYSFYNLRILLESCFSDEKRKQEVLGFLSGFLLTEKEEQHHSRTGFQTFNPKAVQYLTEKKVDRDVFDQLYYLPETNCSSVVNKPHDLAFASMEENIAAIQQVIQQNKLRILYDFPDMLPLFDQAARNSAILLTFLNAAVDRLARKKPDLSYLQKINELFKVQQDLVIMYEKVPSKTLIRVSFQDAFLLENLPVESMLKKRYVGVTIQNLADFGVEIDENKVLQPPSGLHPKKQIVYNWFEKTIQEMILMLDVPS